MSETDFDRASLAAATPHFVQPRRVLFQDVDAAGIVFFTRIFEYFHDAYMAFLMTSLPVPETLRRRDWGLPLVHAEADFLRPLRFGDPIEVGLVRARWEGSRLVVGYRIARPEGGEVVAVGQTAHMCIDLERFQRIEPPEALRRHFAPLEGSAAPERIA